MIIWLLIKKFKLTRCIFKFYRLNEAKANYGGKKYMKNTKDGNLHTNVAVFNGINLMSLSIKLSQLYMFNADNKIAVNKVLQYNLYLLT